MQYFLLEQMRYLQLNGYAVTLVCNMDEDFINKYSHEFRCVSIPMKRGLDILGSFKSILSLYKLFKKTKYDIIQYNTPNASLYSSIAGILAGVPIRYYCMWGIRYVGFKGTRKMFYKMLELLTCKLSTNITLDSKSNRQFCIDNKIFTPQKSHVIWNGSVNGVDLSVFDTTKKDNLRKECRNKYGIEENEFVIGYLGRLMKDKGTNELLAAVKILLAKYDNIKVLIVGFFEDAQYLDHKLIEWAQNETRIIFTGRQEDIAMFYASFDIFVFPSYREGFGVGVIHAGVYAVPSVVTNIPPLLDSIIDGETGIAVELNNVNSLIRGIESLYIDADKREYLGKQQRDFVISRFEKQEFMRQYLSYINQLRLSKK